MSVDLIWVMEQYKKECEIDGIKMTEDHYKNWLENKLIYEINENDKLYEDIERLVNKNV